METVGKKFSNNSGLINKKINKQINKQKDNVKC